MIRPQAALRRCADKLTFAYSLAAVMRALLVNYGCRQGGSGPGWNVRNVRSMLPSKRAHAPDTALTCVKASLRYGAPNELVIPLLGLPVAQRRAALR